MRDTVKQARQGEAVQDFEVKGGIESMSQSQDQTRKAATLAKVAVAGVGGILIMSMQRVRRMERGRWKVGVVVWRWYVCGCGLEKRRRGQAALN